MGKIVGVCGYLGSGSSACVDLLREFEETQVMDMVHFQIAHMPDGLEDLEYQLKKNFFHSFIAIDRFRKCIKSFIPGRKNDVDKAVDEFLNKIVQNSLMGRFGFGDKYLCSSAEEYIIRKVHELIFRLHLDKLYKNIDKCIYKFLPYRIEYGIRPEDFDEASKFFISDILNTLGYHKEKEILVLKHPFSTYNPIKSFKFFENPVAIIVDRDPRDQYLLLRHFERLTYVPHNVDDFIRFFHFKRQSSLDLQMYDDVMFLKLEDLVYNYGNTVKKVTDFVGITQHSFKGKHFRPTLSRNNMQLFKKYTGYESDMKKIERELAKYIYPFEDYPDIVPEGETFTLSPSQLQSNNMVRFKI